MKKRLYHYFVEENVHNATDKIEVAGKGSLWYKSFEIDAYDRYDGPLEMFVMPIKFLHNVDQLLAIYNLTTDVENFFQQCRDVIAVPEKHQDEKGHEGKMNFQAYFHDVPASIESINDQAEVIFALAPDKDKVDSEGKRLYKLAGYVHANHFQFAPTMESDERIRSYYYNMLRISEEEVNGSQIYRRSGVFSTIFGILFSMVTLNDIHFVYATMGKANASINKALKKLTENYKKKWDILPTISNSKISLVYGSRWQERKLVDITDDETRMRELYDKSRAITGKHMFNQFPEFESFHRSFRRIVGYSKSSRAFMIQDKEGRMLAATVAVNWGDYFSFLLDNPKGIFKLVDKLQLTNKLLYAWMTVGDPKIVKKLFKGLSQRYWKTDDIKMFILNSYEGDPYKGIKSSIIDDPMNYFVIYDQPERYKAFQEYSKDENGNIRIFIDTPML